MGGTAGSITGVGLEVGFEDAGKGVSQLVRVRDGTRQARVRWCWARA